MIKTLCTTACFLLSYAAAWLSGIEFNNWPHAAIVFAFGVILGVPGYWIGELLEGYYG